MAKIKDSKYIKYCNFIEKNIHIKVSELPQETLETLITDDENDILSIKLFLFAYFTYRTNNKMVDIAPNHMAITFQKYQEYLNMEFIKRNGLARFGDMRIFDFESYDDLYIYFEPIDLH